jgi:exonuclease SbcC
MRLHRLELQAFGPYAAPQQVDFDRLARSGLFLLEGPTGAGKTTILDAITFALYGGLAGEGSGTDRMRSQFAAPEAESSVRLELSLSGTRFRVFRSPEYLRRKKRGDGFTTQASQVHLERHEDGRWVSLSSNKAEVGDQVTEFVGLNREQFTQVMLLPQGEFAKFLRCGDDDRRTVLTRLFGTQLYDRITAELDRRRGLAVRERQTAEGRIRDAVSAAAEAAGLDAGIRAELLALPGAERRVQLKDTAEELATAAAVQVEAMEVAGTELARAARADEQARLKAGLMTRLTRALAELQGHEQTRARHEQRCALLDQARQADPVRPLLAALDDREAAAWAARDQLLALAPENPDGLDAAAVTGIDAPVMASRAQELAARAEGTERTAALLQHLADAEQAVPGQAAALTSLQDGASAAEKVVSGLEAEARALPARITALEAALAGLRQARAGADGLRVQQDAAVRRLQAATGLAGLTPQLVEAETAARVATDEHQRLVDEFQQKMTTRLQGMAAELAAGLAAGTACPVCGSAEHPAPAQPRDGAVTEQELAKAQRVRDQAEVHRRRTEAARDQLASDVAVCTAGAEGRDVASASAEAGTLAAGIKAAELAGAELAAAEPQLEAERAAQAEVSEQLVEATGRAAAVVKQAETVAAQLTALQAELSKAAQPHASVAARQAALRQASAADRDLAVALDGLAASLMAEADARSRASQEAQSRGFATLDAARAAVLTPAAQATLDGQVTSWAATMAALTAAARADDLAGLDPADAAGVQAAAVASAAALERAQAAALDVRQAHDSKAEMVARFAARLAEISAAEQAADRLTESTETVIRLAGLAKGMDGHRRVALTTYVLRHWFGQVVAAANVRLAAMSSGRYELKRIDEGENKRQRAGLTLSVIDRHTGEERSPKSLSGGETFYTSLALALGLADVVKAEAGGVDLDTLFIDEGFGSLDPDTLDQVLGVIDDLRDRGRAVGIVSHVADLKDRIAERLEVRRLPDGSSTARVVA